MKSIILPLFGNKMMDKRPKQVVFRTPTRNALENVTKNYVAWRYPGALCDKNTTNHSWILVSFIYNPNINAMDSHIAIYELNQEELTVHLIGNAFVC